MSLVTCPRCGGEYAPVQDDGTAYFHACPLEKLSKVTGKVVAIVNPVDQNPAADALPVPLKKGS